MKLYATITNEKHKKESLGGNESLTIEINRGNRRMVELYLTIEQFADSKELVVLDLLNLSNGNTLRVYEHEINKNLPEYKIAKKQKDNGCYECGKVKHLSPFETGYGETRMLCDDCYPEAK